MLDFLIKIAPLGGLVTATIALVAAYFAWRQITLNRQNEAKRQFLNFLDECIKHPLLAEGLIDKENREELHRYRWFVFKLLMCSESILEEFPGDTAWTDAVMENISPHIQFISQSVQMKCYSQTMQDEVAKMLNGNTAQRLKLPELKV